MNLSWKRTLDYWKADSATRRKLTIARKKQVENKKNGKNEQLKEDVTCELIQKTLKTL